MTILAQARHARSLVRTFGPGILVERAARRTLQRVQDPLRELGLTHIDLMGPRETEWIRPMRGQPRVTLVMTPPSRDSGGHMTIMRLVRHLVATDWDVTLAIYDVHGGDLPRHIASLRRLYPLLTFTDMEQQSPSTSCLSVSVVDARGVIPDSDILMATSWQTAHVLSRRKAAGRRLYLIQDFEPWFYAHGDAATLALDSYSLGFHGVAIGHTLAAEIRRRTPMSCESFPFGCEMPTSHGKDPVTRARRVIFYARPSTPRRGFAIGMSALEELQRRRPDIDIHIVGCSGTWSGLAATWHGAVEPQRMMDLYSQSAVGLCLSFTNVSLVPFEMVAAGCSVVVNDSALARGELRFLGVRFTAPDPQELATAVAEELDQAANVSRPDIRSQVTLPSWDQAMEQAVSLIRRHLAQSTVGAQSP